MTKLNNNTPDEFDFDEWLQLASEDQSAFEQKREQYIQDFLSRTPKQHRTKMQQVQWKLDMHRKLDDSPMASCIKMYQQMWDSLVGVNGLAHQLNDLLENWNQPSSYSNSDTQPVAVRNNIVSLNRPQVLEEE